MSERDERQDHETKAEELEYELAEMQERTDSLEEDIEGVGEQWERRKADESVPGATGEPAEGDEDDEDDDGGSGEELDFGRALADDEDEEKG